MFLNSCHIENFRNLKSQDISCNSKFNLFYGLNGAGKSNLLEAIYFLGTGKSFRTHLLRRVLSYQQENLGLYAKVQIDDNQKIALGVQRSLKESNQLRLAGEAIKSHSEIARFIPMQIISQDSYDLLTAGSKMRRRFLDWGVFHVEPNFLNCWQKLNRVVQQRTATIRNHSPKPQIALWDHDLASLSQTLSEYRKQYFTKLQPIISEYLKTFLPEIDFTIEFYPGWPKEQELTQLLHTSLDQDIQRGYTRYGAHRADILIRNTRNLAINAADTLSRGQQKLLVLALKLGQGRLLREITQKTCLFLIDDLPAELDDGKKSLVFDVLHKLDAQIFITSVEATHFRFLLPLIPNNDISLFHVKQGNISPVDSKTELN